MAPATAEMSYSSNRPGTRKVSPTVTVAGQEALRVTVALPLVTLTVVPVSRLLDPSRQSRSTFRHRGVDRVFPTIDLLGPGRPVLWGVTYRFVSDLLGLLDHPVPAPPP